MKSHDRLCSFTMGLVLVLVALALNIVTALNHSPGSGIWLNAALGIIIDTLLAAWFTCSMVKTVRHRAAAGA